MKTNYPLTLLYDAGCPVCSLEMTHLRSLNDAARLVFVDMSAPGFDAKAYGTTLDALNAEIHGICADGRTLRGLEVLRLAYAAVGLGWVLQPTAWRPLRPLADFAYRAFARHRLAISAHAAPLIAAVQQLRARRLARRMAACRTGVCGVSRPLESSPEQRETS